MLVSTYEFLDLIRTMAISRGIMMSVHVESLFINVSVDGTIKIVLDNVYYCSEMAPEKNKIQPAPQKGFSFALEKYNLPSLTG